MEEKEELEVHTLGELIEVAENIYEKRKEPIWYRGHAIAGWTLMPSVHRNDYHLNETRMANEFYMHACVSMQDHPDYENYVDWIAIMQHYGLPTRLLDWTRSLFVAAFFASDFATTFKEPKDACKSDGCVWILLPERLNKHEFNESVIWPMDGTTVREMIYPAFKEYESQVRDVKDKIIACYPVENILRIYTQQSAFTVHNSMKRLEEMEVPGMLKKVVIPADCKQAIRRQLEICGVTLHTVYPDPEHIARELKYKYRSTKR